MPLSTLRHALAGRRRMTRGRRGPLPLRRGALPSPPPCRFIPALSTSSDPNNSSVVVRVSTGGITALLSGDVEPPAQQALLDSGVDLHADVLKVPHHGSDAQDPTFLTDVGAAVSLTSVRNCLLYTSPSPRDGLLSRMPSS